MNTVYMWRKTNLNISDCFSTYKSPQETEWGGKRSAKDLSVCECAAVWMLGFMLCFCLRFAVSYHHIVVLPYSYVTCQSLLPLSSPSPPDCHPAPPTLWLDIRGCSLSLSLSVFPTETRTQSEVGPKDQCETKDSAKGALPNQGHAPDGGETLWSLSNLDAQSHKCSQKETNMATCLAGNTVRAISSTRQHTCATKGIMMRGKFAGFAFWLWQALQQRLINSRINTNASYSASLPLSNAKSREKASNILGN